MNRVQIRRLHSLIAPFMLLPILLTLLTGTVFQFAVITGNAEGFLWLLDLHRGKFGQINLEMVYPFLNALGLLVLAITGISMWLRSPR
ncbi:hypothetical protein Pse7367_0952 [Thalassoporum mexicanum PCC 7367]|uniref:hypothetical protein n=1 Tax=Thalassoporum mexicanum TaxID=3457544 RepID=UPI00029FCE7B|nr:hypothetical protein [Pseudanabaena sp. PCC 7367]AFY69252.1 hypothetical protein Pse7367_0952 [Pseudanabaena sp. PCC 7367]